MTQGRDFSASGSLRRLRPRKPQPFFVLTSKVITGELRCSLKQNLETSQSSATRTLVHGERCGAGEAVRPQLRKTASGLRHVYATVDSQMDSHIRPWERLSVSARDTDGRLAFDAHTDSIDTHQVSLPHHIFIHAFGVSVQTRAHSHFFCTKHCRIHLLSSEACA